MRPESRDGAHGPRIEKSGVHQPVHAAGDHGAHLRREVLTPAHDRVGAELVHQPLVGGRRVGDHPQPLGLAQLHRVAAHGARRPGDRQRLSGPERQLVERQACREAVHRQRCRLHVGRPPRGSARRTRRARPRARRSRPGARRGSTMAITWSPTPRSVTTPSPICSSTPATSMPGTWGGWHVLEPLRPGTTAQLGVGGVDRSGPDADPDLARPRLGVGQLHHVQDLGAAEPRDPHRSHRTAA